MYYLCCNIYKQDNIKIDLRLKDVGWMLLAYKRDQCGVLVEAVLNLTMLFL
jgi:hypothetical protein